jgi:hypothetical protein
VCLRGPLLANYLNVGADILFDGSRGELSESAVSTVLSPLIHAFFGDYPDSFSLAV